MRALIVDDEPDARRLLREYCEGSPGLEVVAECRDGHEAITDIRRWKPDLLFLDVQMPGPDGFSVLESLDPSEVPPHVVFTTAHDRYALPAFDVAAADFLLKPFDRERFRRAVERVQDRSRGEQRAAGDVLMVRSGNQARVLRAEEVRWIEAAGDYTRVHSAEGEFLGTSGLGSLERSLDPKLFARIHRSLLVYLPAIRDLRPRHQGGWEAVMRSGDHLPVGRRYLAQLKARFL